MYNKNNGLKSQQWVQEHRYIMEQYLQRQLHKDERIYHKNGIRDDNRIENLELWVIHNKSKKDPVGSRVRDLLEEAVSRARSCISFNNLSKDIQEDIIKSIIGNY